MNEDREDHKGSLADLTVKVMPTGERRFRMRPKGVIAMTTSVILTKAPLWGAEDTSPWQQAHLHHGVTEHYQLVVGWALYVSLVDREIILTPQTLSEPRLVVFPPGIPHNVLLGPGAEIVTVQSGVSIGNPDRNHEDWWSPADDFILAQEKRRDNIDSMAKHLLKI